MTNTTTTPQFIAVTRQELHELQETVRRIREEANSVNLKLLKILVPTPEYPPKKTE